MAHGRHTKPLPLIFTIPSTLFQAFGTFLLPLIVAVAAGMVFETSEVVDTLPALMAFTLVILFPITLAQILGVILKSRTEIQFWRVEKALTLTRLVDVLHRHIQVVTLRGWTLLLAGCLFTVVALGLKWASFGLMAVLGLFLFYLVTGWTLFISTFLVYTFRRGMGRASSGIDRQMIPAVTLQGEVVEEVFRFRHVPIPWGYYLIVDEPLPVRLRTESRYVVGASARSTEVEVRGRLRATPRGHFFVGPARIWYQDLLGITRVSIASVATAELKVLPRMRPLEILDPPKTPMQTPDILTRPHRFPTEEHFRFREYMSGDDTRRIHWRLSLKSGHLQVRLPENKEISTHDVLLVLDSFLPRGSLLHASAGADQILDALVDAWLGVARELMNRGDKVTLLAALSGHDRDEILLESLPVRTGQSARWQDMGARARWQGRYDIPQMLALMGEEVHGVVVTARFTAPPPGPLPGQSMTWLFQDPLETLPREPFWPWQVIGGSEGWRPLLWILRLPHPAGSEENSLPRRLREAWNIRSLALARDTLRRTATRRAGRTRQELMDRGDAVYRIERRPTHIRLVGLQGQVGQAEPKAAK